MSDSTINGSDPPRSWFTPPDPDVGRALVEAEDRYRSLVEHLPACTYICGVGEQDSNIYMSPQIEDILGISPERMIDDPSRWLALVHPEDRDRVDTEWMSFKRDGHEYRSEYRTVVDGRVKWIRDYAVLLPGSEGRPPLAQGMFVDVSEQRRTERALQETQERHRSLVEHIPAITYVYAMSDADNWVFMSPQVEGLLGYTAAEMIDQGDLWWSRIHIEDRQRIIDETGEFNENGERYRGEYRMIARDGTEVWVQDEARLLRDEQGRPKMAQGFLIDISDRKHLEEQLRQSQRMEAVGRLAGGVAHDFNNLLAVIQSYARFLFDDLGESDPRQEDAGEILSAGTRATNLVRQLLTFSRKEVVELEVLSLNDVVNDMERLLRRSIGEDVRFETHLADDLWPSKVDQGQMEQILANLAVNARDAMPDGGRLTIATENVTQGEGWLQQFAGEDAVERYVCVTVSDSGHGISDTDREHVFEPFYTTKKRGDGTGLGLAMVHGIVQEARGHVSIYSNDGEGTTFKVYLPATDEGASEKVPVEPSVAPVSGEGAVVAVVEDEDAVRRLVERILTSKGYRVVAMGPEEALERVELGLDVDLLLTDVIMPIASGKEIAELLLSRTPGCPVIFMSGYTDDIIARHRVVGEGPDFLQKPFAADDLLGTVQRALAKSTARAS